MKTQIGCEKIFSYEYSQRYCMCINTYADTLLNFILTCT